MKHEWFGFNQKVACELNLSIEELAALRWFIDFKSTDGMKEYIDENNNVYYWVNYKYFAQECPILFKDKENPSESSIRNKVQRLFSKGLSQVLEKKTVKYTSATAKGNRIGTETYFRIIPDVYKRLISSNNSKMSSGENHNSKMSSEYHNSKMSSELNHNSKMSSNSSININYSINNSSISDSDESKNIKKENEVENTYYDETKKDESVEIFEFWNSKKIIVHRNLTDSMKKRIKSKLKKYTVDEIKEAINVYSVILNDSNCIFSYKWSLEDFLTGEDRMKKFLKGGTHYENYFKPKNTQPKRTYTTNVPNKAAEYDYKATNPKGHDNFEISDIAQHIAAEDDTFKSLERKLLGWE